MKERGVIHYAQLSEELVLDYVEHLQSKDWSIATQRKYLISLRAFLRWVERDPSCRGLESFVSSGHASQKLCAEPSCLPWSTWRYSERGSTGKLFGVCVTTQR